MRSLKQSCTIFLLLVTCLAHNWVQAAPKALTLKYEVTRDGDLFAYVDEHFSQDGQHYHIQSTTKGVGLYALLGERRLTSQGEITQAGLKPTHFELLQSRSPSKNLINDFDWSHQTLKMQVKGKTRQEPLASGTQDLLSVMYQFMFASPTGDAVKLPVTTGKKLGLKTYQLTKSDEALQTKAGRFDVVTLADKDGNDEKKVFLANNQQYIPVKVILREDGTTYEQTLIELNIEQ